MCSSGRILRKSVGVVRENDDCFNIRHVACSFKKFKLPDAEAGPLTAGAVATLFCKQAGLPGVQGPCAIAICLEGLKLREFARKGACASKSISKLLDAGRLQLRVLPKPPKPKPISPLIALLPAPLPAPKEAPELSQQELLRLERERARRSRLLAKAARFDAALVARASRAPRWRRKRNG